MTFRLDTRSQASAKKINFSIASILSSPSNNYQHHLSHNLAQQQRKQRRQQQQKQQHELFNDGGSNSDFEQINNGSDFDSKEKNGKSRNSNNNINVSNKDFESLNNKNVVKDQGDFCGINDGGRHINGFGDVSSRKKQQDDNDAKNNHCNGSTTRHSCNYNYEINYNFGYIKTNNTDITKKMKCVDANKSNINCGGLGCSNGYYNNFNEDDEGEDNDDNDVKYDENDEIISNGSSSDKAERHSSDGKHGPINVDGDDDDEGGNDDDEGGNVEDDGGDENNGDGDDSNYSVYNNGETVNDSDDDIKDKGKNKFNKDITMIKGDECYKNDNIDNFEFIESLQSGNSTVLAVSALNNSDSGANNVDNYTKILYNGFQNELFFDQNAHRPNMRSDGSSEGHLEFKERTFSSSSISDFNSICIFVYFILFGLYLLEYVFAKCFNV